ncbi:RNA-binding protein 48 [Latimeria chalumnae]|uniref:RNA-binding protein 48 n=1 Tax=Latimeria chalumnae TaxID=7897 RepID=UPI00313CE0B6
MAASSCKVPEAYKRHEQGQVCFTRAKYREGRRLRAVKVYTINLESRYLLVQGVPAVGVMKELVELFALYGTIEEYRALDEYPAEKFTEVYLMKFQKLQSARVVKRKLDERSFFGGLLHVCYAPEFETVQDTREKLQERRRFIARATVNRDKDGCGTELQHGEKAAASEKEQFDFPHNRELSGAHHPNEQEWNCYSCFDSLPFLPPPLPPPSNTDSTALRSAEKPMDPLQRSGSGFEILPSCPPRIYGGNQKILKAPHEKPQATDSAMDHIRFVPRTTQLQERKRRKDQVDLDAFIGTNREDSEIIIGPKLPEIPKVDMGDDSLNVSAKLIRGKLEKASAVSMQKPEERKSDFQTQPAPKQRRRI